MPFTIEPMSFGEILSRAVSLLFTRLGLFVAIQAVVTAPTLVMELMLPDLADRGGALLFLLPMIILGPIGSAAMLHVIAQEYLNQPVSFSSAFGFALPRFLPLLGTSILASMGIAVGFMCFCIPGIYLAIIWAFANQVVVMETLSGSPALTRSSELVKGYFGHVFGVLFLVGFLVLALNISVTLGLSMVLPFGPNPLNLGAEFNYLNYAINQIAATTINAVGQTFTAICATLLYFDLRNRKEAFDVSHIVKWMDRYRDWRDEPDVVSPASADGPAETGIKESGPSTRPPETGIKDADNSPR